MTAVSDSKYLPALCVAVRRSYEPAVHTISSISLCTVGPHIDIVSDCRVQLTNLAASSATEDFNNWCGP